MTRLSTSRPDWSVPIQCAASGSISLSRMLTAKRVVGRDQRREDRGEHQQTGDAGAGKARGTAASVHDTTQAVHDEAAASRGLSDALIRSATRFASTNTIVNTMTTVWTM